MKLRKELEKISVFPFFYAFSGFDVTFYGISKNKWWEIWSKNEKLNKTFIDLSWTPICVTDAVFTEIEQMVSSMYCASHSFTSLSELSYLNHLLQMICERSPHRRMRYSSMYVVCGWLGVYTLVHT